MEPHTGSSSLDEQTNDSGSVALTSLTEEPLYLEDLEIGDQWTSESREISAEDVADFAMLTGDNDPLHSENGETSPFGEPIAHGLLGLSVLAGLSSVEPKVATLAFVGVTDWQFEAPVFFGDQVHVVTRVESIEPHGRRAGRVVWFRQLINQHGRVVQQGRFICLVSSVARSRRRSTATDSSRRSMPAR